MPQPFAAGERAFAFCDRCGFRYPLGELQFEVVKLKRTGLKVCPTCFDPDHPQLQLGMYPVEDPQALREPRVDVNRNVSNAVIFQPGSSPFPVVGATVGCPAGAAVGKVRVVIV
jgi:hypothetical protein